ncbi:asparagine synthase-related protein [Williamwhitmania taraxaci]|uniref:asparagine synthase (glutamine-hydrolyzing) n=1 Tax=Williamwhitmania taraxaci TaxID=1640674 RepID=A0A1G6GGZ3_9BACT|nr:asparagine synthase-related protein [Williamwhitmania taraxaci]SDB81224.1 Asparagine synthase [Williamwhitmania taraxaci]
MNYPTIIISTDLPVQNSDGKFSLLETVGFNIAYNKSVEGKIFIYENANILVLAHCNYGFLSLLKLKDSIFFQSELQIIESLKLLQWGFLSVCNKQDKSIVLYNDIYGLYPLYYSNNNDKISISNDFDELALMQNSLTINNNGVYDYLLFNYTLKSRTLFNEIVHLEGGSKIFKDKSGLCISVVLNVADLIKQAHPLVTIEDMCANLSDHVRDNIELSLPIQLPLTGGFDSKIILSLLLHNDHEFSAYTFGDKSSPDCVTAMSIAKEYSIKHRHISLSEEYLCDIEKNIKQFIRDYPNAPMLDTLMYYQMVRDIFPPSNIVTGKMGGELIVGPVLISELITTRVASLLTLCKNGQELISGLMINIEEVGFVDRDLFMNNINEYTQSLSCYRKGESNVENLNIALFLLKETYAKFFGPVFCVLFYKHNLINPLVDLSFVIKLLNSKFSFLKKKPFSKEPFSHFMSRRLYPLLVRNISPSVLNTPMDRGYNLKDFLHWYNFPKPFLNYFTRHFLPKKPVKKPLVSYMPSIKGLVKERLISSSVLDLNIFDKDEILRQITDMENGRTSRFQDQRLIQLLTLHYIFSRYTNKIIV